MDKTIEYYNQNADMFAQGTRLVDFMVVQERFRKMLPVGSRILDFGCGSGDYYGGEFGGWTQSIFLRRDTGWRQRMDPLSFAN